MRWTRRCRVRMRSQGGATRERSREARETSGSVADGQSVWSWHPLLVSSWRRRVGPTGRRHVVNSSTTVARRIRRRGKHAIHRKTIAWGMPDDSGASAVNTGAHTKTPQRAPGCGCIGHPAFPAPSSMRAIRVSGKPRARLRGEIAKSYVKAALFDMRSGGSLSRGLVVRDARRRRAPHREGLSPHPEEPRAAWRLEGRGRRPEAVAPLTPPPLQSGCCRAPPPAAPVRPSPS